MSRNKTAVKALMFLLFFFITALTFVFPSGRSEVKDAPPSGSFAGEPAWVRDPYTKYDRQANVAAVGNGSGREAAEKDALGRLVSYFGQSIQVDEKVSTSYQDAVKGGAITSWSETTTVNTTIGTTASLDSLVGAEIGDVWNDGKGSFFAVAFLNKQKTNQIYSDIIKSNQQMIDNLTRMSDAEKNSLDGFARYQLAATIADVTVHYGDLVALVGGSVQGLKRGDDYRLEAVSITRAIPVGIRVQNDRSRRIEGAFAKALSDLGFRSGGNNSRYLLDVDINLEPVALAGNPNVFSRITLKANLMDSTLGTVLLPYDFNSREGHTSQSEADNRAYTAAERKINSEYAELLAGYLSGLLPKR